MTTSTVTWACHCSFCCCHCGCHCCHCFFIAPSLPLSHTALQMTDALCFFTPLAISFSFMLIVIVVIVVSSTLQDCHCHWQSHSLLRYYSVFCCHWQSHSLSCPLLCFSLSLVLSISFVPATLFFIVISILNLFHAHCHSVIALLISTTVGSLMSAIYPTTPSLSIGH